jgi:hypothetical protein
MKRQFGIILVAEIFALAFLLYGAWSFLNPAAITAALADVKGPEIAAVDVVKQGNIFEVKASLRNSGSIPFDGTISLKILKDGAVAWDSGQRSILIEAGLSEEKWLVAGLAPGNYAASVDLVSGRGGDTESGLFVV